MDVDEITKALAEVDAEGKLVAAQQAVAEAERNLAEYLERWQGHRDNMRRQASGGEDMRISVAVDRNFVEWTAEARDDLKRAQAELARARAAASDDLDRVAVPARQAALEALSSVLDEVSVALEILKVTGHEYRRRGMSPALPFDPPDFAAAQRAAAAALAGKPTTGFGPTLRAMARRVRAAARAAAQPRAATSRAGAAPRGAA